MPKFSIGNVVSLNTHPYSTKVNNIVISGEYLMIPPLMVVIEIIDYPIVNPLTDKANKYKCLWFSTKKNQFQESYFIEADLKFIQIKVLNEDFDCKIGDLVSLSTLPVELGKKRSFLNTETNQTGTKILNSISGLLSFVSPIMTITEIVDFDSSKDKKTASELKHKKTYPKVVAKCKWFDSVGEKFSECFIPLEALVIIPITPDKLLEKIYLVISQSGYLKLSDIIIKPIQISNRSGVYQLSFFNYVTQQNHTQPILKITDFKTIKNPFKSHAPVFKRKSKGSKSLLKLSLDVDNLIKSAMAKSKKRYLFIKYQDRFGNITNRTISKYEYILGDDELKMAGPMIKYVRAFCHLRQADRNFRLHAILQAGELDLYY